MSTYKKNVMHVVRELKNKNVNIQNAFKDLGKSGELSDEEYKKAEELIKKTQGTLPIMFDNFTDLIFGKLPDTAEAKKQSFKDGTEKWRFGLFLMDGRYASFLVDEKTKKEIEVYMGNPVAVVGKLNEKLGKGEHEGKNFLNIDRFRDVIVLTESDAKNGKFPKV